VRFKNKTTMDTSFTLPNFPKTIIKPLKPCFLTILLLLITIPFTLVNSQCPAGCSAAYTSNISTSTLPVCVNGTGSGNADGDLDNGSGCTDHPQDMGDNCYRFVITRHDPQISGISTDIGKGDGCNGEVNTFYTLIDGVCTNRGSSGSQNTFTFDFGPSGVITIWLCDGSSGQVSLCDLCAEPLVPVPVELIDFSAKQSDESITLDWRTASEENNAGFEIQRKTEASDWISIGYVDGKGTTSQVQSYQYIDRKPIPGQNYYRLKQMDFDGQFEFSPIRTVLINASKRPTNRHLPKSE
jgi:hypothetical protein